MAITPSQITLFREAHALGRLDREIAAHAGVSLATVKRYRTRLGLATNCQTARRGSLGERLVAEEAARRGYQVEWREKHNARFDLYIGGQRVEVKTSMQTEKASWHFRLHRKRRSFYGRYSYSKSYARDCHLVALVTLFSDGTPPDFYLFLSAHLPGDIRIRAGGSFEDAKNDWRLCTPPASTLQA